MSSSSSPSGRGRGYRRGGRYTPHHRHHQADQEPGDYNPRHVLNNHADDKTSESQTPRYNPRRGSRSRNHHKPRPKPQFVEKREGIEGSGGELALNLEQDSSCGDITEKDCGGKLDRLSLGESDGHKSEAVGLDKGKGVAIVDELKDSGYESDGVDPVKRLDKMIRLSLNEAELSEELLSINNQLQEDELLAMESIYGQNMVILDDQNGLRCFQVHIRIEVSNGLTVTSNFNSSNSSAERADNSADFSYSFKVEHLQPVILTCVLPKSYPSNCAPLFTISVQWLSSDKISDLCHKLDSIWQEQFGQEVIYQWVEWLQNCTLPHLGFESEVVLGPYGLKDGQERRAISGCVSPNIDIPSMKTYNDEQRQEDFRRNIQECPICFSENAGSDFIRLPCQHFFCWKCMKTFTDIHINDGTVLKIQCPESKCGGMIPPYLLQSLLGVEEFERWESLTLQKTLEGMSDVEYCPRCETACLEDKDNHAQCSKCYYNFCTLCREKLHVGVECMTPETKLCILQERQKSTLLKGDQRRREGDMINQILSMREIARSTKPCPSCNMAISRTEGCNKIVCDNCGQYFCYRCNQSISGYEHFREGQCELFPADELKRWEAMMNGHGGEERMNGRQIAGQMQAEMFEVNTHACPNCRQRNLKVGNNNHIFCWACQNHYCYLCRKVVRRGQGPQHYGPKGCKQHTEG